MQAIGYFIWNSGESVPTIKSRRRNVTIAAAALLFSGVAPAAAQSPVERYVLPAGRDSVSGSSNDCAVRVNPCKTIEHAVIQAASGDSIILLARDADGVTIFPHPNDLLIAKDLDFRGDGAEPRNVEIRAPGSRRSNGNRHFAFQGPITIRIENLTLTGGRSANDAGSIEMTGDGRLVLKRVIFSDNLADGSGGAIGIDGELIANNAVFRANRARLSGGALLVRSGKALITNSTYANNEAERDGGAVAIAGGSAAFRAVQMANNAAERGGAIACKKIDGVRKCTSLRIEDDAGTASRFVNNNAISDGGALFTNADTVILGTDFVGNEAVSPDAKSALASDGGAIFANGLLDFTSRSTPSLSVEASNFANNFATGDGGAVAAFNTTVTIRSSTFSRNVSNEAGGSLRLMGGGGSKQAYKIINSTFRQNRAYLSGGAIKIHLPGKVQLLSLTLVDNSAIDPCASCIEQGETAKAQDILIEGAGQGFEWQISNVLIEHVAKGMHGPECDVPDINNSIMNFIPGSPNLIQTDSCGDGFTSGTLPFRIQGNAGSLTFRLHEGPVTTRTFAIDTDSAAHDAGGECTDFDGTTPLELDQRGLPRTDGLCDIGAYEIQPLGGP